jgi:hypothetical protein
MKLDLPDSKSGDRKALGVQIPYPAAPGAYSGLADAQMV